MSGPPDGPLDVTAQLAALAAQIERMERANQRAAQRGDQQAAAFEAAQRAAEGRIADAEQQAARMQAALDQAVSAVKDLTEQAKAQRLRGGPPALSWLDPQAVPPGAPPAPPATEILSDLAAWLERVYARLPGPRLPACWAFHPGVVDMLLALRMAHAEVYTGRAGTWEKVVAWHLRSRPDMAKRISDAIGRCELRQHIVGRSLYQARDREVPLAGFLDVVAAAWADRRETPDPTALMLAAADRYTREDDSAA